MRRLSILLAVGILLGITIASGTIHGRMSNRWGSPRQMREAAGKLRQIPDRFGSWRLRSEETLSDQVVETLECAGYVVRTYVDEQTGKAANVAVLMGPAMPISLHTPEICYSSREFSIRKDGQKIAFTDAEGGNHEFRAVTLQSNDLRAAQLRVYYAWSTGQVWRAPDRDPRLAFLGAEHLYKLQLVVPLENEVEDPGRLFLERFVPVAGQFLVASVAD